MSDFNPLDRAKIAVHRSSFDLSSKKLFTAKVGEILPCYWQIDIPGTKYRISSDWFTRTVPVNTAAYTRIKEYYDVYAVPLRLISRALPQAFTQMTDYMTSASSPSDNTEHLTHVPYTSLGTISTEIAGYVRDAAHDDAGFNKSYGACKLLDYLGYGAFIGTGNLKKDEITANYLGTTFSVDSQNPLIYGTSMVVNLLPLLSYQKIYFDFYSNSQWEKHLAYAYNVDYWTGGEMNTSAEWFKIRYSDYPKDYFMGVLPASQYGSVATFPSYLRSDLGSNAIVAGGIKSSDVDDPRKLLLSPTLSRLVGSSFKALQPSNYNDMCDDSQRCLDLRASTYCRDMIKHKKLNDANNIFNRMV